MLIYDPDIAAKMIAIVKKLLHEGKLTPACIDESNVRIVQCKERLGKFQEGRMASLLFASTRWSTRR